MGISTHILDTSLGRPASHVRVSLSLMADDEWTPIHTAETDSDGRCKYLLPESAKLRRGIYCIHFETDRYYKQRGTEGLYPYVDLVFEVRNEDQHYHIPLLLTANGYTTYRGS
jgi:5-hydroxyisourate hydrolase